MTGFQKKTFSKNFERDWEWYLTHKNVFTFSGSVPREIKEGDLSAKECFFKFDSHGVLHGCSEPELLKEIFLCKESVNFQIKEWAQDRAKGYLPLVEFEKIIEEFGLLEWMVKAVEKQKFKYYEFSNSQQKKS